MKLTNVADCVERGLVKEGQDPLAVAADQLTRDGVDVLHTIGGDDTNTTAADLAAYLARHGYDLTVVGLPKTIDNDIVPVQQSLGAWTAAEQGAIFAENIIAEHSSNPGCSSCTRSWAAIAAGSPPRPPGRTADGSPTRSGCRPSASTARR